MPAQVLRPELQQTLLLGSRGNSAESRPSKRTKHCRDFARSFGTAEIALQGFKASSGSLPLSRLG